MQWKMDGNERRGLKRMDFMDFITSFPETIQLIFFLL